MPGAVGTDIGMQVGVDEDQVVARAAARQKFVPVGDVDARPARPGGAEKIARHAHHRRIDLYDIEAQLRKMVIEKAHHRAPAQPDQQTGGYLGAVKEARHHGARIGVLQHVRLPQVDHCFDHVDVGCAEEVKGALRAGVDDADMRIVRADLVDQNAGARRQRKTAHRDAQQAQSCRSATSEHHRSRWRRRGLRPAALRS